MFEELWWTNEFKSFFSLLILFKSVVKIHHDVDAMKFLDRVSISVNWREEEGNLVEFYLTSCLSVVLDQFEQDVFAIDRPIDVEYRVSLNNPMALENTNRMDLKEHLETKEDENRSEFVDVEIHWDAPVQRRIVSNNRKILSQRIRLDTFDSFVSFDLDF